jgi:hypothetical protein
VTRKIASIAVALAIIAALTGSACLACMVPAKRAVTTTGCCNTGKTCHKSKTLQTAQTNCQLGKTVDLTTIEKPANKTNPITPAVQPTYLALTIGQPTGSAAPNEPKLRPYTVDLYLLNSALTI